MAPITARLSDLAADVLFTSVLVTEATELSAQFFKVTLACDAFTRATWTPGDKLQIRPRRGSLAMRTYTPIDWNRDTGATAVIAYRHGDGPAVGWFEDASAGDMAEVFGPSRSLDLSDTVPNTVFIGDETSVGLAYALTRLNPAARYIYEATDPAALEDVLNALGIGDNTHCLKKSDDPGAVLSALADAIEDGTDSPVDAVVTGDAATVSAVRRDLRRRPGVTPRIKARAYWARGRTGLS
ncbi:oxidoreductase [Mycolicibacter minnesotensis]|uniref:Oxidoreductase n=1 Tax=Mycolicibacter minnesotensis TaxID=1118379 RepID=A0A7I7R5N6_9MYCO|nr:siderophore-interacting protein [Mycolicibacter minnesotensis]ORA97986.1 oxidoreductase [Mycolicibacter minnesotensis]BBY33782.1 hypothetical protein MMIN_18430 [Mycolicibacter minnesotensis]